jgi:hypothetical protein
MPDLRAMHALSPAVREAARRLYEHLARDRPELRWLGGPSLWSGAALADVTSAELRAALDALDPAALCDRGVELGRALDRALIHYQRAEAATSGWRY